MTACPFCHTIGRVFRIVWSERLPRGGWGCRKCGEEWT